MIWFTYSWKPAAASKASTSPSLPCDASSSAQPPRRFSASIRACSSAARLALWIGRSRTVAPLTSTAQIAETEEILRSLRESSAALPHWVDLVEAQLRIDQNRLDEARRSFDAFLGAWDGQPVGAGRLHLLDDGWAKLERIAVRPRWRGRGIAHALHYAIQYMDGKRTLKDVVDRVTADIHHKSPDILTPYVTGDIVCFRKFELAAAINRMRTLMVAQMK